MKFFLVLILVIVSVGAQGMADPNFVPANSPEQVAPGADDMMDTTATLNQLDEQEKEEDMKAAEEARIQAQEAADQQNYRDDVPSEEMLPQEEP
jgi:hypothetical protein